MAATETFIPVSAVGRNGRTFDSLTQQSPCDGCSAPCCRILITPHPTPLSFSDLDYIRYVLGFPRTEMIVHKDGTWQMATHRACSLLDEEHGLCTVHGTPRKPKVCVYFDPYKCWYKRNFTTPRPPDIVRLDADRFERLLAVCAFDENGAISEIPRWEQLRAVVEGEVAIAG
jgi:hypothetical protein